MVSLQIPLHFLCIIFFRKGFVHVKNPYLDSMDEDVLYHLDLGTKTHNLPEMFGDVKVKVFLTLGKTIEFPLVIFLLNFLT